ncbi:hypothetical protein NC653_031709 [Populus alba x Populus x berolinensis]|uniref:Uncharacterized protein n=1 Tax=Populus alba x Populus x berolinensis TaxID=444605 RepID=A0AAD6M1Z0_9ROSI|nr:hypothetical protein NC653_031709 [Populus alba x Populus x berolinensis]
MILQRRKRKVKVFLSTDSFKQAMVRRHGRGWFNLV